MICVALFFAIKFILRRKDYQIATGERDSAEQTPNSAKQRCQRVVGRCVLHGLRLLTRMIVRKASDLETQFLASRNGFLSEVTFLECKDSRELCNVSVGRDR